MPDDAKLNYCAAGGTLVTGEEWYPVEPFDYAWAACNRLACSECGVQVRTLLGFELPPSFAPADAYELIGANDRSRFVESPKDRIYTCRHYAIVPKYPFPAEQQHDMAPWTPWQCAGHPQLSLPAVLEGIAVDDNTDWGQLARESFAGTLGVTLHPSVDGNNAFWIHRLYLLLGQRPAIANAAADLLLDSDPRVRRGAIEFFRLNGEAAGAERAAMALHDHPELFVDVLVDGDSLTLERQLLEVLNYRIVNKVGDTVALELMRAALSRRFQPVGLERYLFAMAEVDQKWLLEHGDALVAAVPELWENMQAALVDAGAPKRQVTALKERVRARHGATP
jgi:hypothetical protein